MFTGNVFVKEDEEFGKKAMADALQLGHLVSALKTNAGLDSLTRVFELPYGGTVEVVDNQHTSFLTIWPPARVFEVTRDVPKKPEESTEGEFLFAPPIRQSWVENSGFASAWGEDDTIFDAIPLSVSTEGKLLGGNAYVASKFGGGYLNTPGSDETWLPSTSEFIGYVMWRGVNPMHAFYIPVMHTYDDRGISSYGHVDNDKVPVPGPSTPMSVAFAGNIFWNGTPIWASHTGVPGTFLAGVCYHKKRGKLLVVVQDAEDATTQWLLSYDITMPEVKPSGITGQPVVNLLSMETLATWDARYDTSTGLTDRSYAVGSTVFWTFSPDGTKAVKQFSVFGAQRADISTFEIINQVETITIGYTDNDSPLTGAYAREPITTLCTSASAGLEGENPNTVSTLSTDRVPLRVGFTEDGERCEYGAYASEIELDDAAYVANIEFKAYYKTESRLYLPDLVLVEAHGIARSSDPDGNFCADERRYNLSSVSCPAGWVYSVNGLLLAETEQWFGPAGGLPCVDLRTGTMVASVCTTAASVSVTCDEDDLQLTHPQMTIAGMHKDLFLILNKEGSSVIYPIPKPPRNPTTIRLYDGQDVTKNLEFRLEFHISHNPSANFYSFANTYDGTIQVADDGAIAFSAITPPMHNNTIADDYNAGVAWYSHGWDTFVAVPTEINVEIPAAFEFEWLPDVSGVDMSGLDGAYASGPDTVYRFLGYLQYANLNNVEGL